MILLFDIGNTNIVMGICEDNKIIKTYRYVTNPSLTNDDYFQKIDISIKNYKQDYKVEGAIISCVVSQLDRVFATMIEKYFNVKAKIIGPGLKSGLKIKLENPKELGADLLCDAVGAYEKYQDTCIIIDMGTATKLIVVNDKKEFLGGSICAGLKGSLNSLINSTSKLSTPTIEVPNKTICNETLECIQSGIVYGHISMIEGLVAKMKKELNNENVKIVLTGGNSVIIKDHLNIEFDYDENILLKGLLDIYNKNK